MLDLAGSQLSTELPAHVPSRLRHTLPFSYKFLRTRTPRGESVRTPRGDRHSAGTRERKGDGGEGWGGGRGVAEFGKG